ncbi:hypothetical protein GGE07_002407 [Sinorhizobium terangae]|nr:hypothetical protein [Sinorhizobium terangae]
MPLRKIPASAITRVFLAASIDTASGVYVAFNRSDTRGLLIEGVSLAALTSPDVMFGHRQLIAKNAGATFAGSCIYSAARPVRRAEDTIALWIACSF